MDKEEKTLNKWNGGLLVVFALVVLWNQSIGSPYGYLIGFGGLIVGIIALIINLKN